jgi:hypothetical protein
MHPIQLIPTEIELFEIGETKVLIPKTFLFLDEWVGKPVKETFGGKPIVMVDEKPMFAELAIVKTFIADGWDARWIETYARANREPICLIEWKDEVYKNQNHVPILEYGIKKMISDIARENSNSYVGCWDVLAWKNNMVVFAESKRSNRDRVRDTQNKCLGAGLKCGLKPQNFLIVEWNFK